ncbi:MAG: hypothetical protein IJQ77_05700 [Synergistaceae bacterium]|nr:hypothetical protein [Synergistaceae bacterium]
MRHHTVDRKVAGIIRWLERLKKSYSDGAIENALMDAECARADLENLRNDVWQKVKSPVHKSSFDRTIRILKCVSLAVIVILFHVGPIAKDNVPVQSVREEMKALTQTQPKPIIIVREYEHENEKEEKHEKHDAKAMKAESPQRKISRRQVTQRKSDNKPAVKTVTRQVSQKTVPYDKVLSLVQTGQRALKENTSVISIKK